MKNSKRDLNAWEYATFEGAERFLQEKWRKMTVREKFHWLEEARLFVEKIGAQKIKRK